MNRTDMLYDLDVIADAMFARIRPLSGIERQIQCRVLLRLLDMQKADVEALQERIRRMMRGEEENNVVRFPGGVDITRARAP